MNRIAWITPSSFVDVDLPIVTELQKEIDIYWQVVEYGKVNNDMRDYINSQMINTSHIRYEYIEIPYLIYDPRTLFIYFHILKKSKAYKPDLLYTSLDLAPFWPNIYLYYYPQNKIVAACHNVSTPKGANKEMYSRFFTGWSLRTFHNIQVFSDSQRDILLSKFPSKNVLLAPLAIKDYGNPTIPEKEFNNDMVVFLFFGIISPYKRLDLLINAAQDLYQKGYKNFKVLIAGSCKTWSDYNKLITIPEIFETRIERIPNSDIANLFARGDYFVMPYQDIAQSGAITVAYRYTLPIILSDLPQFRPYGIDGENCLFFESNNVMDLEEKMLKVINGGRTLHDTMKNNLSNFVKERFSITLISRKYLDFFNKLI